MTARRQHSAHKLRSRRRRPVRAALVALLVLVLVPTTALARVVSICSMSGRAVATKCCCEPERDSPVNALERADCCRTYANDAKAAASSVVAPVDVAPAAVLTRLPAIIFHGLTARAGVDLAARARGPPPLGPPIYLRVCRNLN